MNRLSQSVLGAADKCLLSAQYTIDRPSWVQQVAGSARAVGTGYHAGLELYYLERMAVPGLRPDLPSMITKGQEIFEVSMSTDLYDNSPVDVFKWDETIPDQEHANRFIERMLTAYVNGTEEDPTSKVWPDDWQVLGVEVHAQLDDPEVGMPTKFGADLVLRAPDDGIVLVDQKSAGKAWGAGKEHPRKNVQAPFYGRNARRLYPDAPYYRFVFDIMTLPKPKTPPRFSRRISDPKPEHEAAIVKKAVDFLTVYHEVHVRLGRDLPANPASTLCNPKWCDFFEGCPFGRALEA